MMENHTNVFEVENKSTQRHTASSKEFCPISSAAPTAKPTAPTDTHLYELWAAYFKDKENTQALLMVADLLARETTKSLKGDPGFVAELKKNTQSPPNP